MSNAVQPDMEAANAYGGQGFGAPFRMVIVADLNFVLSLTDVAVTVTVFPAGTVLGAR